MIWFHLTTWLVNIYILISYLPSNDSSTFIGISETPILEGEYAWSMRGADNPPSIAREVTLVRGLATRPH
jgi:hypothetical protein